MRFYVETKTTVVRELTVEAESEQAARAMVEPGFFFFTEEQDFEVSARVTEREVVYVNLADEEYELEDEDDEDYPEDDNEDDE